MQIPITTLPSVIGIAGIADAQRTQPLMPYYEILISKYYTHYTVATRKIIETKLKKAI